MGVFKEFKDFALKGNVVDMAVGVIIGGAFSKIISSLVSDIITPALSLITGRINIKSLAVNIEANGSAEPILIAYGMFLQNIIDFFIIAVCIFFAVKLISRLNKKKAADVPAVPPAPTLDQQLLTEIRDIIKKEQTVLESSKARS